MGLSTYIVLPRAKQPFCEKDNAWFTAIDLGTFDFIQDAPKMVENLEKGIAEVFDTLQRIHQTEQDHSAFTLYSSNKSQYYLSIENRIAGQDKDGNLEFKEVAVIEYISITKALKEILDNKEVTIQAQNDKV